MALTSVVSPRQSPREFQMLSPRTNALPLMAKYKVPKLKEKKAGVTTGPGGGKIIGAYEHVAREVTCRETLELQDDET